MIVSFVLFPLLTRLLGSLNKGLVSLIVTRGRNGADINGPLLSMVRLADA